MLKLEAPWQTFQKKVAALFAKDPDIIVGGIYEGDDTNLAFDIEVKSHDKYVALDRLLPNVKRFGNVTLGIVLYDEENEAIDLTETFKTLFKGNPLVASVETHTDEAGGNWNYVVFKPEVIQFFDDNLADYHGNWSGLAQDIAPEVFEENSRGVYFCTEAKETNALQGQWP